MKRMLACIVVMVLGAGVCGASHNIAVNYGAWPNYWMSLHNTDGTLEDYVETPPALNVAQRIAALDNTWFLADRDDRVIRRYSRDGTYQTNALNYQIWSTFGPSWRGPQALDADLSGNLFISSAFNTAGTYNEPGAEWQIHKFSAPFTSTMKTMADVTLFTTVTGQHSVAGFAFTETDVFVAAGQTVYKFNSDASEQETFLTLTGMRPFDLEFDPYGNLWVAGYDPDRAGSKLLRYNMDGELTFTFDLLANNPASLAWNTINDTLLYSITLGSPGIWELTVDGEGSAEQLWASSYQTSGLAFIPEPGTVLMLAAGLALLALRKKR